MSKKLEAKLAKFQGNAYPAMLEHLGRHLGVSAESLRRLELGWAPIVEFKKGPNYQGWWVIPERDAGGEPVGLSLRSQSDMKVMYPGSKHGLIYPVNPDHERGGLRYQHGAHNWVRVMDAGVLCPVCGKPDGCLVSRENPEDPKAVTCIRVKTPVELNFGWLHVLKPEGNLNRFAAVLPPSDLPVIVVEGMTDTAAAMDLGFVAVGRPSNLAGMDLLCDVVRGRDVIVVGENDRKPDGTEPGREGMVAAFQMVQTAAKSARMVMPPESIKDLRQWKGRGLTADEFLAHVEAEGKAKAEIVVLPDDRPRTVALQYLDDLHRMAGRHLIKRWNNTWYRYNGAKYVKVDDETFEAPLYAWAHEKQVVRETANTSAIIPLRCDNSLVNNVLRALKAETLIETEQAPCWVNDATGPDPHDLIVFENGILYVPAFLEGAPESEYLLPLTPDFFTTAAMPFVFDPLAECRKWKRFMRETLGHEQACIQVLQEWFGYCMTPDISMQKLMYLRGPSGAGKSVILNVLRRMVGKEQQFITTFDDLTETFGVEELMGKLVCTVQDARSTKSAAAMRGLERLLNIAGGDAVKINRKYKTALATRLTCKITLASNEFLDVPDHAGAMLRRLNVIEFKRSFEGKEDFQLEDKLAEEIPGIAVWALRGLGRLRKQGRFTLPESSKVALREWRTSTSPMAAFLEECTDHAEGSEVRKEELFDTWNGWAMERGMRPLSKSKFYERLRSAAPYVVSDTYEKGGHKFSVFRGLALKRWAAKQFLGRPDR